jgi:hypothetical protein
MAWGLINYAQEQLSLFTFISSRPSTHSFFSFPLLFLSCSYSPHLLVRFYFFIALYWSESQKEGAMLEEVDVSGKIIPKWTLER